MSLADLFPECPTCGECIMTGYYSRSSLRKCECEQLTECQGDPFGTGFHPSDHAAFGVGGAPRFNPYRKGKAA